MEAERLIAITSDIDWAEDEVISYMLAILDGLSSLGVCSVCL